jgi:hypothetical protein
MLEGMFMTPPEADLIFGENAGTGMGFPTSTNLSLATAPSHSLIDVFLGSLKNLLPLVCPLDS